MKRYDYVIIGAGFSGAVLAERIASQLNKKVLVVDKRNHIGGNCYDYKKHGIYVQKYGPHIFHTKNKEVFDYLNKFTKFNNYKHKVVAIYKGEYYPIPINLDTVNKFYGINLKNVEELKKFLETKRIKVKDIKNSEDVVVSKFGIELYDAFVKTYTKKCWAKYPSELDKSVLERLPIKYDKDPYYFQDKYQGMPVKGFGDIFNKLLSNKNITLKLNTDFFKHRDEFDFEKMIFTGRLDQFFDFKYGKLDYRSINYVFKTHNMKSFQPHPVVNFPENNVKYSRITEFKKFHNVKSDKTITCTEFFTGKGDPTYPIYDKKNLSNLKNYNKEVGKVKNVIFVGRLAEYKYYNMDSVIEKELEVFNSVLFKT